MVCRASLGRFARTSKCGGVLSVVMAACRGSRPIRGNSVSRPQELPEPTIRPWESAVVGSGDVSLPGQRSPQSRVDLLGGDPSDYRGQRALGLERLLRLNGAPTRTGNCDLPGAPQPWLRDRPAVCFVSLLPPKVREALPA
jgi:hypothetical protein